MENENTKSDKMKIEKNEKCQNAKWQKDKMTNCQKRNDMIPNE